MVLNVQFRTGQAISNSVSFCFNWLSGFGATLDGRSFFDEIKKGCGEPKMENKFLLIMSVSSRCVLRQVC